MTEIFSVPQQDCSLQRIRWTGVEQMWNLIRRTKGYLSQTQKLQQRKGAGKANLFQQWQEMSPLTNNSNGQRRQYPEPKESASLHSMAWRWGQITWLEFKFTFCGFSIPVMCFWSWKITPFPFWVQTHHQILRVCLVVEDRILLRPPV